MRYVFDFFVIDEFNVSCGFMCLFYASLMLYSGVLVNCCTGDTDWFVDD